MERIIIENQGVRAELTIGFRESDGQIVAWIPSLDLTSCGKNEEHAYKMIQEALDIWLHDLLGQGQLEEALQELGWKKEVMDKERTDWLPPAFVAKRQLSLSLNARH